MATFEKRKNTQGQVTAIRVKIRRVGLPHLSQTFPIANPTPSAIKQAEKAAKDWADEVVKSFDIKHGNIKQEFNALAGHLDTRQPGMDRVNFPFKRILSRAEGDDLINAGKTDEARLLLALMLDCGLTLDECLHLRWQHVDLPKRLIDVLSTTGLYLRQTSISKALLSMMLACNHRKYGLVMTSDIHELAIQLPEAFLRQFGNPTSQSFRAQSLRMESAHRLADIGHATENICSYLGLRSLESLRPTVKEHSQYVNSI